MLKGISFHRAASRARRQAAVDASKGDLRSAARSLLAAERLDRHADMLDDYDFFRRLGLTSKE